MGIETIGRRAELRIHILYGAISEEKADVLEVCDHQGRSGMVVRSSPKH